MYHAWDPRPVLNRYFCGAKVVDGWMDVIVIVIVECDSMHEATDCDEYATCMCMIKSAAVSKRL